MCLNGSHFTIAEYYHPRGTRFIAMKYLRGANKCVRSSDTQSEMCNTRMCNPDDHTQRRRRTKLPARTDIVYYLRYKVQHYRTVASAGCESIRRGFPYISAYFSSVVSEPPVPSAQPPQQMAAIYMASVNRGKRCGFERGYERFVHTRNYDRY